MPPRKPDRARPSTYLLPGLILVQGAAFLLLLGLEGRPVWRVVRVVSVVAVTAAAIRFQPWGGRVRRGMATFAMGIAGTVAGAGIGGAHLAKVGLSLTSVAGLVALATGVSLLVWGIAALTGSLPGWWRLLVLPAGLALLVFVVYPLTVAVNATNRPATLLGSETPADHGMAYEDVAFTTGDAVRLSAWYLPSRNGAAVVLLHGAGSTRSAVLEHGIVLARRGYGVLMPDTRGHGLSDGDAMDFGWYGEPDIAAAVTFLEGRADVSADGIAVVGLSMGGEQAIAAAGSDPRIRAVVAEGVTGMQAADHGWLERYGFRGAIQRVIDWVTYGAADLLSGARPPQSLRDAIRAAGPRPVLLIAGGRVPDESHAGRYFREASPETVHLWVVPGAGHTGGLDADPERWAERVTSFLDRSLGVGTAVG